jgi:hypothetical protein
MIIDIDKDRTLAMNTIVFDKNTKFVYNRLKSFDTETKEAVQFLEFTSRTKLNNGSNTEKITLSNAVAYKKEEVVINKETGLVETILGDELK